MSHSGIQDYNHNRYTLSSLSATDAPALGNTTNIASTGSQPRLQRFSLQNEASRLLPNERVNRCLRCFNQQTTHVEVQYVARTGSAHYAGLETCGSIWICPVCAAKITERRKIEIEKVVKACKPLGYRVVMATYTFRHSREDSLKQCIERLTKAMKSYKSGRAAQKRSKKYSIIGSIRALEVTYSDVNGWHVHIHELIFMSQFKSALDLGEELRTAWKHAGLLNKLDMDEHGFKLDECNDKVVDYIAKFGVEPSVSTLVAYDKGWNESSELTKWHVKQSKAPKRAYNDHCTPFQLLNYSLQGDKRSGQLFIEYANAFKGRHQLQWSQGLKDLFAIEDFSDEELAEQQEEEAVTLVRLSYSDWRKVLGNDCRGELLEIARTGNLNVVKQFLEGIGIHVM